MKIELDHIQRLNLHALLGAQCGDVATIRALWTLQDKLALIPAEEKAIELKAGHEHAVWNSNLSIAASEFEFAEAEFSRLRGALEAWAGYGASSDRKWLADP